MKNKLLIASALSLIVMDFNSAEGMNQVNQVNQANQANQAKQAKPVKAKQENQAKVKQANQKSSGWGIFKTLAYGVSTVLYGKTREATSKTVSRATDKIVKGGKELSKLIADFRDKLLSDGFEIYVPILSETKDKDLETLLVKRRGNIFKDNDLENFKELVDLCQVDYLMSRLLYSALYRYIVINKGFKKGGNGADNWDALLDRYNHHKKLKKEHEKELQRLENLQSVENLIDLQKLRLEQLQRNARLDREFDDYFAMERLKDLGDEAFSREKESIESDNKRRLARCEKDVDAVLEQLGLPRDKVQKQLTLDDEDRKYAELNDLTDSQMKIIKLLGLKEEDLKELTNAFQEKDSAVCALARYLTALDSRIFQVGGTTKNNELEKLREKFEAVDEAINKVDCMIKTHASKKKEKLDLKRQKLEQERREADEKEAAEIDKEQLERCNEYADKIKQYEAAISTSINSAKTDTKSFLRSLPKEGQLTAIPDLLAYIVPLVEIDELSKLDVLSKNPQIGNENSIIDLNEAGVKHLKELKEKYGNQVVYSLDESAKKFLAGCIEKLDACVDDIFYNLHCLCEYSGTDNEKQASAKLKTETFKRLQALAKKASLELCEKKGESYQTWKLTPVDVVEKYGKKSEEKKIEKKEDVQPSLNNQQLIQVQQSVPQQPQQTDAQNTDENNEIKIEDALVDDDEQLSLASYDEDEDAQQQTDETQGEDETKLDDDDINTNVKTSTVPSEIESEKPAEQSVLAKDTTKEDWINNGEQKKDDNFTDKLANLNKNLVDIAEQSDEDIFSFCKVVLSELDIIGLPQLQTKGQQLAFLVCLSEMSELDVLILLREIGEANKDGKQTSDYYGAVGLNYYGEKRLSTLGNKYKHIIGSMGKSKGTFLYCKYLKAMEAFNTWSNSILNGLNELSQMAINSDDQMAVEKLKTKTFNMLQWWAKKANLELNNNNWKSTSVDIVKTCGELSDNVKKKVELPLNNQQLIQVQQSVPQQTDEMHGDETKLDEDSLIETPSAEAQNTDENKDNTEIKIEDEETQQPTDETTMQKVTTTETPPTVIKDGIMDNGKESEQIKPNPQQQSVSPQTDDTQGEDEIRSKDESLDAQKTDENKDNTEIKIEGEETQQQTDETKLDEPQSVSQQPLPQSNDQPQPQLLPQSQQQPQPTYANKLTTVCEKNLADILADIEEQSDEGICLFYWDAFSSIGKKDLPLLSTKEQLAHLVCLSEMNELKLLQEICETNNRGKRTRDYYKVVGLNDDGEKRLNTLEKKKYKPLIDRMETVAETTSLYFKCQHAQKEFDTLIYSILNKLREEHRNATNLNDKNAVERLMTKTFNRLQWWAKKANLKLHKDSWKLTIVDVVKKYGKKSDNVKKKVGAQPTEPLKQPLPQSNDQPQPLQQLPPQSNDQQPTDETKPDESKQQPSNNQQQTDDTQGEDETKLDDDDINTNVKTSTVPSEIESEKPAEQSVLAKDTTKEDRINGEQKKVEEFTKKLNNFNTKLADIAEQSYRDIYAFHNDVLSNLRKCDLSLLSTPNLLAHLAFLSEMNELIILRDLRYTGEINKDKVQGMYSGMVGLNYGGKKRLSALEKKYEKIKDELSFDDKMHLSSKCGDVRLEFNTRSNSILNELNGLSQMATNPNDKVAVENLKTETFNRLHWWAKKANLELNKDKWELTPVDVVEKYGKKSDAAKKKEQEECVALKSSIYPEYFIETDNFFDKLDSVLLKAERKNNKKSKKVLSTQNAEYNTGLRKQPSRMWSAFNRCAGIVVNTIYGVVGFSAIASTIKYVYDKVTANSNLATKITTLAVSNVSSIVSSNPPSILPPVISGNNSVLTVGNTSLLGKVSEFISNIIPGLYNSTLNNITLATSNVSSIVSSNPPSILPPVISGNNSVLTVGNTSLLGKASEFISNVIPGLYNSTLAVSNVSSIVSSNSQSILPPVIPGNNGVLTVGNTALLGKASEFISKFMEPKFPKLPIWSQSPLPSQLLQQPSTSLLQLPSTSQLLQLPSTSQLLQQPSTSLLQLSAPTQQLPVAMPASPYLLEYNLPTVMKPVSSIVGRSVSADVFALLLLTSSIWAPLLEPYTPQLVSTVDSALKSVASSSVGRWFASTTVGKWAASSCSFAKKKMISLYNSTNSALAMIASTSVAKYCTSVNEKITSNPICNLVLNKLNMVAWALLLLSSILK